MIKTLNIGEKYLIKGKDWSWLGGQKIPVLVKKEYKYFYIVDVLPHYYYPFNFGLSTPYSITINKAALSSKKDPTIAAYNFIEKE